MFESAIISRDRDIVSHEYGVVLSDNNLAITVRLHHAQVDRRRVSSDAHIAGC